MRTIDGCQSLTLFSIQAAENIKRPTAPAKWGTKCQLCRQANPVPSNSGNQSKVASENHTASWGPKWHSCFFPWSRSWHLLFWGVGRVKGHLLLRRVGSRTQPDAWRTGCLTCSPSTGRSEGASRREMGPTKSFQWSGRTPSKRVAH